MFHMKDTTTDTQMREWYVAGRSVKLSRSIPHAASDKEATNECLGEIYLYFNRWDFTLVSKTSTVTHADAFTTVLEVVLIAYMDRHPEEETA
jgi:hypothetical protein